MAWPLEIEKYRWDRMNADLMGCDGPRLKGSWTAGEAANLKLHANAMAPFNGGTTTIYLRALGTKNGSPVREALRGKAEIR